MSTIRCPVLTCRRMLQLPAQLAEGATVQCPSCSHAFAFFTDRPTQVVPTPGATPAPPAAPEALARKVRMSPARQRPQPKEPLDLKLVIGWGIVGAMVLLLGGFFIATRMQQQNRDQDSGLIPAQQDRVDAATVRIQVESAGESAAGSGFLYERHGTSGVIVTNYHLLDVTQWPPTLRVVFHSGTPSEQTVPASILFLDKEEDLAVLLVEKSNLPAPLTRADPKIPPLNGNHVWAFGFPRSPDPNTGKNPTVTITAGTIRSIAQKEGHPSELHVTNTIRPGNSGGPLVNREGKLVGIVSALFADPDVGAAIPVNRLEMVFPGQVLAPDIKVGAHRSLQVDAARIDPHARLRTAHLLAQPRSTVVVWPRQLADGTWEGLKVGALSFPLRLEANHVTGATALKEEEWQPGEWVFQIRYTTENAVRYSAPRKHPGFPPLGGAF